MYNNNFGLFFFFLQPIEVLIQGAHLHRDNVGEICQLLREQIHRLENLLAHGKKQYSHNYNETIIWLLSNITIYIKLYIEIVITFVKV